jgi:hypothetical protein
MLLCSLNELGQIIKWYGSSIDIQEQNCGGKNPRKETELRQILDLAPQHIGVFAPSGEPLYSITQDSGISAPPCGEPIRVGLKPLINGQGLDLISFIRRIVNILLVKERRDFSGSAFRARGSVAETCRAVSLFSYPLRSGKR